MCHRCVCASSLSTRRERGQSVEGGPSSLHGRRGRSVSGRARCGRPGGLVHVLTHGLHCDRLRMWSVVLVVPMLVAVPADVMIEEPTQVMQCAVMMLGMPSRIRRLVRRARSGLCTEDAASGSQCVVRLGSWRRGGAPTVCRCRWGESEHGRDMIAMRDVVRSAAAGGRGVSGWDGR